MTSKFAECSCGQERQLLSAGPLCPFLLCFSTSASFPPSLSPPLPSSFVGTPQTHPVYEPQPTNLLMASSLFPHSSRPWLLLFFQGPTSSCISWVLSLPTPPLLSLISSPSVSFCLLYLFSHPCMPPHSSLLLNYSSLCDHFPPFSLSSNKYLPWARYTDLRNLNVVMNTRENSIYKHNFRTLYSWYLYRHSIVIERL